MWKMKRENQNEKGRKRKYKMDLHQKRKYKMECNGKLMDMNLFEFDILSCGKRIELT